MKLVHFLCVVIACNFFSKVTDAQYTQPILWLKPSLSNSGASVFVDYSLHMNPVQALGRGTNLDSSLFNYNPSLLFSGTSKQLVVNNLQSRGKDYSLFITYEMDSGLNREQGIYFLNKDTNVLFGLSSEHILSNNRRLRYSDSSSRLGIVNVLVQTPRITGRQGSTMFTLGSDSRNSFKGKIGEVILFNQKLTRNVRNRYETYLALKYSITLDSVSYFKSNDSCIWDREKNRAYHFGIAGIGRDSLTTLNQKQSSGHSGRDIISLGLNNLFESNISNTTIIPEGEYLVWGHTNHSATDIFCDTLGVDTILYHQRRKYKIVVSGDSINKIPSIICFRAPSFPGYLNPFISFHASEATISTVKIPDSTDALGNVYFKNLLWDSDGNGYDIFSFGFLGLASLAPLNTSSSMMNSRDRIVNRIQDIDESNENESKYSEFLDALVYPNPTAGSTKLHVKSSSSEEITIKCFDYSGKLISTRSITGRKDYLLDDLFFQRGHYLILVYNKSNRKLLSLIVQ